MITCRIHGKKGQGITKAIRILGDTANISGFYSQGFIVVNDEMVTGHFKMDKSFILSREEVNEPDFVLLFCELPDALGDISDKTVVITNSNEKPNFPAFRKCRAKNKFIDADKIADIPNIVMVGAMSKFTKLTGKSFKESINLNFQDKAKENLSAFDEGCKSVK